MGEVLLFLLTSCPLPGISPEGRKGAEPAPNWQHKSLDLSCFLELLIPSEAPRSQTTKMLWDPYHCVSRDSEQSRAGLAEDGCRGWVRRTIAAVDTGALGARSKSHADAPTAERRARG